MMTIGPDLDQFNEAPAVFSINFLPKELHLVPE